MAQSRGIGKARSEGYIMKDQAWKDWWSKARGDAPVGSYDPREEHIYKGWSAGWEAAEVQSQLEIMHLKAQLLRVGNQQDVLKAAYLAGQMSVKEKK